MLDPDDPATLRRISDSGRLKPADETLRNLLGTLNGKLELCARLPFLAYEADREGHEHAAAAFRQLAATERRSLDELLSGLRLHLECTGAGVPAKGAR